MKKYFLLALLFGFQLNANGQSFNFDSTSLICQEKGIYLQKKIICDENNNKYVFGVFKGTITIGSITINTILQNTNMYSLGCFVAKYNQVGILLDFKKLFESDSLDSYNVQYLKSGHVSIVLSFADILLYNQDTIKSVGNYDIFSFCIDTAMSHQWNLQIGDINGEFIKQSSIANDGSNIFIGGSYNYYWFNNYPNYKLPIGADTLMSDNQDFFITKVDKTGMPIWSKSYGGAGQDGITALKCDGNFLYMVGGLDALNNNIDGIVVNYPLNYTHKALVAKLDTNGNVIWIRKCGENNTLSSYNIFDISVKNNNVCFTGIANSNTQNTFLFEGGPTLTSDPLNTGADYFIASYDIAGNFRWNTISNSFGNEYLLELVNDSLGNLLGIGEINYNINFPTDTLYSHGGDDILVLCYDSLGIFKWAINGGGTGADVGSSITIDSHNKPYIVGGTTSNPCYMGNDTLYPILGQSTLFVSSIDSDLNPVGIHPIVEEESAIFAFPNPVNDYLQLMNVKGSLIICLYNQIGQKMSIKEIGNNKIDTSHLPNGIYYLSIRSLQNSIYKTIHIQH